MCLRHAFTFVLKLRNLFLAEFISRIRPGSYNASMKFPKTAGEIETINFQEFYPISPIFVLIYPSSSFNIKLFIKVSAIYMNKHSRLSFLVYIE